MSTIEPGTYKLDPSHSEVGFEVRHAGISKVRGLFEDAEATLTIAENSQDNTLEAVIKTASIYTHNEQRDGHIKGEEFFNVEKYPEITFKASGFTIGQEDFTIPGELTILDTTKEIELTASYNGTAADPMGNTRAGFEAETTISRKDFGLSWNAALEAGGVLVSDKVKIVIDASLIKE
ncbi:MAG: YceI family protein [Micrococcaceae bacterium]